MKKVFFAVLIPLALIIAATSCQNGKEIEFNRYYSAGAPVYQAHCQNCHGVKGEGLKGLIPPLTDSAWFKNNRATLTCFIKNGFKGDINVSGKSYSAEMPASDLSPLEIAQVVTYVTNSFGNKMETMTTEQASAELAKCH